MRIGPFRAWVYHVLATLCVVITFSLLVAPGENAADGWAFIGAAAAVLSVASAVWWPDNHGRGRTLQSQARRTIARLLIGPVKPCGCWGDADSDTIESEPFVLRETNGSRIIFRARNRELRRCHSCGRHYHATTRTRLKNVGNNSALVNIGDAEYSQISKKVELWPEDEPEAREHITAPVEREGDA